MITQLEASDWKVADTNLQIMWKVDQIKTLNERLSA